MDISIFGLGYVGTVSAACLANEGHTVIGVDVNPVKVELIDGGRSPIVEKDVARLISEAVRCGRLKATTVANEAVQKSELSLVCVGTPSQPNGALDLEVVREVCAQIGTALAEKAAYHLVVIRSTLLPGSIQRVVIPTLEKYSGKQAGKAFGLCINPEFLREGTAVYDYRHPPKTVIGELDRRSGELLAPLYAGLDAPLIRTAIPVAEMVKYADNSWHALKICFANEIGEVCRHSGIDSHEVMDIFCRDEKLNISRAYLKPGFAFGGSCLPKDVRALNHFGKHNDLQLPLLNSVLPSNRAQIERCLQMIMANGKKRIGILGISFKAETDDLRESPMIEIVEILLGKGYELCIYDPNVQVANLLGANKDYLLNRIPHISRLMVAELESVLKAAEVLVIGTADPEFVSIESRLAAGCRVVDFIRLASSRQSAGGYQGISW